MHRQSKKYIEVNKLIKSRSLTKSQVRSILRVGDLTIDRLIRENKLLIDKNPLHKKNIRLTKESVNNLLIEWRKRK